MGSKRSFLNVILSKSRQSVGSMKIDCDSDGMKASAYSDTGCQTLVMELPVTTGTCEGNPDPDPGMPGFIKASCPTSGTTKVLNGGSTTDPAGPGDRNHMLIIVVGILLVLGLGIGAGVIIYIRRRRASSSAVNVLNINADEHTFDDEFSNDAEF